MRFKTVRVRTLGSSTSTMQLMVETFGEIVTVFFLIFFIWAYFSNDYYQFRSFTSLQNRLFPGTSISERIGVIEVDAEAQIHYHERFGASTAHYIAIADALSAIGTRARPDPLDPLIVGIDYVFAGDNPVGFYAVARQLASLDSNVSIVFGAGMSVRLDQIRYLNLRHIEKIVHAAIEYERMHLYSNEDRSFSPDALEQLISTAAFRRGIEQWEAKSLAGTLDQTTLYREFVRTHEQNPARARQAFVHDSAPALQAYLPRLFHATPEGTYRLDVDLSDEEAHLLLHTRFDGRLAAERQRRDRFFVGNVHYMRGTVRSGLDSEEPFEAAIGYRPAFVDRGSWYFSLPFAMYLLHSMKSSEIAVDYDLVCDIRHGDWLLLPSPDNQLDLDDIPAPDALMHEAFHGSFEQPPDTFITQDLFYNFRSHQDVTQLGHNLFPLSVYSPAMIAQRIDFEGDYIIIAGGRAPAFIMEEHEDLIITAAAERDPMTEELLPVIGAIAHITALDNLVTGKWVTRGSKHLFRGLFLIALVVVAWTTWRSELPKSLSVLIASLFVLLCTSFIAFLNGSFYSIRVELSLLMILYGLIMFLRFYTTYGRLDNYAYVMGRIYPLGTPPHGAADVPVRIRKTAEPGPLLLVIPKDFPDFEENYAEMYDFYIRTIFSELERYGAAHDTTSYDGVLGFWPQRGEPAHQCRQALNAATAVMRATHALERHARQLAGTQTVITLDACLHFGAYYAGTIRCGSAEDFLIQGKIVNEAMHWTVAQTADKKSSLIVSASFSNELDLSENPGPLYGIEPRQEYSSRQDTGSSATRLEYSVFRLREE